MELIESENGNASHVEHAVLIHFNYGQTGLQPLFDLEDELEAAINEKQVGEFDGHEMAVDGSEGYLYMYGPNADKLFDAIEPVLAQNWITKGAEITKRYGPPGDETDKKVFRIEDSVA